MGLSNQNHGWTRRLAVGGGGAVFALSAGMAMGQATTKLVVPSGPLLPASFAGWSAAPGGAATAESSLVTGTGSQVFKEDGLVRSAQGSYERAGRPGTLHVDALQFDDATGAVSAYTYLRSPEMRLVAHAGREGREEAISGDRILFREGSSVVLAQGVAPGAGLTDDLHALAGTLPKISGPKAAPPLLPTLLPESGVIPGSVHYAVGAVGYQAMGGTLPAEILGFDKSAETVTAQYDGRGGKGVLTLLLFPTPQIAGDRGRAVEAALNASGERAGTAKLRREGPMVILARGGFTADQAQTLVESVHLRQEVSWNKAVPPEFHTEVRKTASLLVSIAVLSGVLGLAAVLLGLFLGFGRAWIRVLMGKPAAMEPEFLRLNLGRRNADGPADGKAAGA